MPTVCPGRNGDVAYRIYVRDPFDLAAEAGRTGAVVVLTGAGVSAESGIPTFRGPEGFWTVGSTAYRPEALATRAAFDEMPEEVWRWYLWRRGRCRAAEPNGAHRAIVALERALGDRFRLVSQNVDGLHRRAGSGDARSYYVHGDLELVRCADECTLAMEPLDPSLVLAEKDAPWTPALAEALRCRRCGGWARPHVLWFDECYDEPRFRFESALRAAAACDLLVTIGTAAATNLPNQIVGLVARRGAAMIDVNPDGGRFAEIAASLPRGAAIRGTAGDVVPRLCAAIAGT
jgi:NAD-dependent deacetylase